MSVLLETDGILKLSHKVGQSGHWFVRLSDRTLFWSDELFRLHGMLPGDKQPDIDDAGESYHSDDRERIETLEFTGCRFRPFQTDKRPIRSGYRR
ncbi:hypothetical protein [Idiomarina sp.]|uniref:hypothetical protein n=1 Tax=Idiomarina sp. TaxID=1874361 RepID=UPI003A939403